MNKYNDDEYNRFIQEYIDKFGEMPPTIGSIYDILSDNYVDWLLNAIKSNKKIDLSEYYDEDTLY